MKILAIETSCDDTAIAIVECFGKIDNVKTKILANAISSQTMLHAKSGGIIPNLAAREHEKNLIPVFNEALKQAKIKKDNLANEIDLVAVTRGPGLQPSLLMGLTFAKTLAYIIKKPIVGANHLLGHILSNLVKNNDVYENKNKLPMVCLLVSGGHTQLYKINSWNKIELLGETLDDASGECFDKIAKTLKLGYPGGVFISKIADQFKQKNQNAKIEFNLPKPLINSKDYNFSFSGLKTAVLYLTQKLKKEKRLNKKTIEKICWEVQEVITDVLVKKTINLAKDCGAKTIMIAGGVSANQRLRSKFIEQIDNQFEFLFPDKFMSTDNAVMIAIAGYYKYLKDQKDDCLALEVDPNEAIKSNW